MPPVGAQNFDKRRGQCVLMITSEFDNKENQMHGLRLCAQYPKPRSFVEQKSGAWNIPLSRSVIDIVY